MAVVKIKLNDVGRGEITLDGKPIKCLSFEIAGSVETKPVISLIFMPDELEIDMATGDLTQYVVTNDGDFTPTKEQPFRKEIEPC